MSYEITIRKANCLDEGIKDPVFMTIASLNSCVALLSRSDALELFAARDMRMALEATAEELAWALGRLGVCGEGDGKDHKADADSLGATDVLIQARDALKKAEGKEQA